MEGLKTRLWIDAILLGAIAALCIQWVARSWRAERPGIKVLVAWTTLASVAYTAWLLVLCLRYFVFGFGEYLQFEQVGCEYPFPPRCGAGVGDERRAFLRGKVKELLC